MAALLRAAFRSRDAVRASRPSFSRGTNSSTPPSAMISAARPVASLSKRKPFPCASQQVISSQISGLSKNQFPSAREQVNSSLAFNQLCVSTRLFSSAPDAPDPAYPDPPIDPETEEMRLRRVRRHYLDKFFRRSFLGRSLLFLLRPFVAFIKLMEECAKEEDFRHIGEGLKLFAAAWKYVAAGAFLYIGSVVRSELEEMRTTLKTAAQDRAAKAKQAEEVSNLITDHIDGQFKQLKVHMDMRFEEQKYQAKQFKPKDGREEVKEKAAETKPTGG